MKTIILPGYSPHNKDWALDIKKELKLGHPVLVHEWRHWPPAQTSGSENLLVRRRASGSARQFGSFSVPREIEAILEKVDRDKINIIAKSVGTRVAMHLIVKIPDQINKVILCGIPTKGESDLAKKTYSEGLSVLSPTQIIVFQNEKDPFASYETVKKFVNSINSGMKLPRAHARGIFSARPTGSEILPKREMFRIHPRTYALGFLRRRIKVISMPRSDHHYPYVKDFQEFLRG